MYHMQQYIYAQLYHTAPCDTSSQVLGILDGDWGVFFSNLSSATPGLGEGDSLSTHDFVTLA
jgi:hypothetical protein